MPDWPAVHRELRKKGVTLQLLWQEYRAVYPEGYGYSRYCELYRAWAKTVDVTMRFEDKAGQTLYVDFATVGRERTCATSLRSAALFRFVDALGRPCDEFVPMAFLGLHEPRPQGL